MWKLAESSFFTLLQKVSCISSGKTSKSENDEFECVLNFPSEKETIY